MSDNDDPQKETTADPGAFRTLSGPGISELKIKGSRFLGRAHLINSEEEAKEIVDAARSKHYDARHICYGLRVGLGASRIDRSNDDGEPPRSGGYPIWQILSGEAIENALVLVIRYFGGTKLGIGGLTRAYRDAAQAAIDDAGTVIHHPEIHIKITVPYDIYDELEHLLQNLSETRIVDRAFTANVDVKIAVWKSRETHVRQRISELLGRSPDDL